eukprot:83505_1
MKHVIQGQTSYNDWFYTEYTHSGCYGSKPYYYSATNGYYIYWELGYNRWQSDNILGSNDNEARDSIYSNSLFASNGKWYVISPTIGTNMDPCLEIHSADCNTVHPANCNTCTMDSPSICVTGKTTYNSWFYTEYTHSGCYGSKPYYYSATNGYYIYWELGYNRWQSDN